MSCTLNALRSDVASCDVDWDAAHIQLLFCAGQVKYGSVCIENMLKSKGEQKVFLNLVVPREICLVGYLKKKQKKKP